MSSLIPPGNGILSLVLAFLFTLALAWASFVLMKATRPLILHGRGWIWSGLAGILGMAHWPLQLSLGSPAGYPIVGSILYLFSMAGLAPDDSVLERNPTPAAFWFQRGLISAIGGTSAGMARSWLS
ncbi:hypothetical protein [Pseudoxanthomonas broegbernensis]|uniref:hypothetical protein n=1 Tax=Pseudoxanthomonas broegbernensis TaxID=83619 RepID=UPI001391914C|nr:hypothetical protein [Pseudoxanthomonas broegbernensis]MBB6065455.1 hypothetical protein [Pseudoxanthomonas broegbernensis]